MPMKPMTTDGMAASSSMPAFRISFSFGGCDLGDVQGAGDADGDGDEGGTERDEHRTDDQRKDAELRRVGDRIPELAEQEVEAD